MLHSEEQVAKGDLTVLFKVSKIISFELFKVSKKDDNIFVLFQVSKMTAKFFDLFKANGMTINFSIVQSQ